MSKPPPASTVSAVGPCPTVIQSSRRPRCSKLTKHRLTTRPPTANGVAALEGSPIRYNIAIFLKIETLCFNEVLGLATPLAPIHLETHLLSGVMLVC